MVSKLYAKFQQLSLSKAAILASYKGCPEYKIKGSIESTHGSVCSDVRKLQSMDVLKLQSSKADWKTKCPFHILAYIYNNVLDISTSYFIKMLSCRERLDVDSKEQKIHLSFG